MTESAAPSNTPNTQVSSGWWGRLMQVGGPGSWPAGSALLSLLHPARWGALLLAVAPGSPLLQAERVSYTYGDKAVELRRGQYLTAHHHYQNDLS